MSKAYLNVTLKVLVDTGISDVDEKSLTAQLAERLDNLGDIEDGMLVVTDQQITLEDVK